MFRDGSVTRLRDWTGYTMRWRVTASLLSALLGLFLASGGLVRDAQRAAAAILKQLDATRLPGFDKAKAKDNPVYTPEFMSERDKAMEKRAALIGAHSEPGDQMILSSCEA
jgi:hypothetical protein